MGCTVEKMYKQCVKQYDAYIEAMKNAPNKDACLNIYLKCCGMLELAMKSDLIQVYDYFDMHDKAESIKDAMNEPLPFEEVPTEEQEPFEIEDLPFPEVMQTEESGEPEEQPADEKQEYVESQYKYWLEVCGKPQGCDEEHLNYLHGYFTMAGEIGAVSMHRAEDMVHELTHVYDTAKESEIENERRGLEKLFHSAFGLVPNGELLVYVSSQGSYYEWKKKSKKYKIEINQDGKVEAMIKKWNKDWKDYEKVYTRTYDCIDEMVSVI